MIRLAALLTAHNRKESTLTALENLFKQVGLESGFELCVYLVDDGSTDGTSTAVKEMFPQVILIQGSGNLYWSGGMRLAFGNALKNNHDYYLWLNDDTSIFPDALVTLLDTSNEFEDNAIIVGSTQDPDSKLISYGGVKRFQFWRPLEFSRIPPTETSISVETMNGNCVLIPKVVSEKVGNIDPVFKHGGGDFDYGLRAKHLGFNIIVARGFVGTCKRNNIQGSWKDSTLPLRARINKVLDPTGLPPREWFVFARRYGGLLWPFYWLFSYRYLFFPSCFA